MVGSVLNGTCIEQQYCFIYCDSKKQHVGQSENSKSPKSCTVQYRLSVFYDQEVYENFLP